MQFLAVAFLPSAVFESKGNDTDDVRNWLCRKN